MVNSAHSKVQDVCVIVDVILESNLETSYSSSEIPRLLCIYFFIFKVGGQDEFGEEAAFLPPNGLLFFISTVRYIKDSSVFRSSSSYFHSYNIIHVCISILSTVSQRSPFQRAIYITAFRGFFWNHAQYTVIRPSLCFSIWLSHISFLMRSNLVRPSQTYDLSRSFDSDDSNYRQSVFLCTNAVKRKLISLVKWYSFRFYSC